MTAEGWPNIELDLNHVFPPPAMSWNRAYIILFLFIGHFVFSNLFVAVIIGQIDKGEGLMYLVTLRKEQDFTNMNNDVKNQSSL